MLLYFILLMLKVTLGSETITSATLSPKLWLILVISNNFIFIIIFFLQGVCYQQSKRSLSTKCLTFSETIH